MTSSGPASRPSAAWLYGFVLVQFACQAALIAPLGPARIGFRTLAFASSLALLGLPAGGRRYPLRPFAAVVVGITAANVLNPLGSLVTARVAQALLVAACWAPVFWVGRVHITPAAFRKLLLIVWSCNTLSAAVGVLQTYDERFSPDPEFLRQIIGADVTEELKITLNDGRKVFRPMGLSDSPGGAGLAGSFAVLGGLGVLAAYRNPLLRAAAVPGAVVGMYAIYMSQVRFALAITAFGAVGIIGVLAARGRLWMAGGLLGAAAVAAVGGFVWAGSVGEEVVVSRLSSLAEESAGQVYYSNRGRFVEDTWEQHIPDYPLGAGLGRYGMMASYFGDKSDPGAPPLWAELQLTAWVYDGGVPLLLAGLAAVGAGCLVTLRIAFRAGAGAMTELVAVVTAVNVGVVATLFAAHVFTTQAGIMFWTLNASLYAAAAAPAGPGRGRP